MPDCPGFLHLTDGLTVSPFVSDSSYSASWQSFSDITEPPADNLFGYKANGMVLGARGSVSFY